MHETHEKTSNLTSLATRLTVHEGTESNPRFSPDGRSIAFTGQYDSNQEVYVSMALSLLAFESMRLTLVGLSHLRIKESNRFLLQGLATSVVSVAVAVIAISQYYQWAIGYDISIREVSLFGTIFFVTALLYMALVEREAAEAEARIPEFMVGLGYWQDPTMRPGVGVTASMSLPWLWGPHDEVHHHHRRYTHHTLRAHLEAAGWRVESLTYMNMLLLPLAMAQRLRERVVGYNPQALSPSPRVNALLWRIWQLERFWIPQRRLPVGLSLLAVARPGAG